MIKKRDLILFACFLVLGVVLLVASKVTAKKGECVCIYQNGKIVATWSLSADSRKEFTTDDGTNTVVVESGKVYVTDADCADGTCMKMGKISMTGESIICAPHKLIVRIENYDDENYIDGVS